MENNRDVILKKFNVKAGMKQKVFSNTYQTFSLLKELLNDMANEYNEQLKETDPKLWMKYKDRGRFQASFKFGGDLLLFNMHSNVFEFDRDHSIWNTAYAKKKQTWHILRYYKHLQFSF